MFGVYMETQGNKPYLFEGNIYVHNKGEYTDYDIPPDALTDPAFAALVDAFLRIVKELAVTYLVYVSVVIFAAFCAVTTTGFFFDRYLVAIYR